MFWLLVQKELKAIIQSPKFAATFAVCSILMLLSVYLGIQEYQATVRQYETATGLAEQQLREKSNWNSISQKTLRQPDPLMIFAAGVHYDIGRWSRVSQDDGIKLQNSTYLEDPILAVFRFLDFTFIVQIVLSLFAILFTYNAINGEREEGTLKLIFSNSVPRAQYLIAKCAGSWLGLVVPLSIPLLLSLLLVLLFKVPLVGSQWAQVGMMIGASLLFFTFFIVLGVCLSAVTRRSNVSFLLALVAWITFVLIIPRAGVLTAGQMVSVPSVAEIEGRQDAFAKNSWAAFYEKSESRWTERGMGGGGCGDSTSSIEIDDEKLWAWMAAEDSARKIVEDEIEANRVTLTDDLRRRKTVQEKLALTLSRFSPVSAYQLAVMSIAGSGIELKSRYEDALNEFRGRFVDHVEQKQAEAGQSGQVMISISSEDGFNVSQSRDAGSIDLTDLPHFAPPVLTYAQAVAPAIVDFGLLALYTLLAFIGAFVMFLRYDVR